MDTYLNETDTRQITKMYTNPQATKEIPEYGREDDNISSIDNKTILSVQSTDKCLNKPSLESSISNTVMTNSSASILDDTTPSDSGVQLLDSESSGLNESIMSNSGFDFDTGSSDYNNKQVERSSDLSCDIEALHNEQILDAILPDLILPTVDDSNHQNIGMTKSDIENSNICLPHQGEQPDVANISEELISSTCSTFDTENIVYRRRVKKNKNHSQTAPKKRVSFHEDILKNTKTDNIHIEHGFITYKGNNRKMSQAGRYSWCSEGDGEDFNENNQYVYRNACSDVLDYGKTDIYENEGQNYIKYDNSGVFEYGPQYRSSKNTPGEFYKCNCSSSNSSLESNSSQSDEQNANQTAKKNYGQAKSSSCDCIGITQNNNGIIISENCYYSEPNIETLDEEQQQTKPIKSVWSKERKPKSSCLKKSRRHTDIVQEHDLSTKMKKFNVHQLPDMNNLIDNSKMIFGSLKNIFSMPLPERGVPEGSEDLQSVCECIPENESFIHLPSSPIKSRPFLSKSLDGGFNNKGSPNKKFIHNVDEQLRRKNDDDLFAPSNKGSRKNSVEDILPDEQIAQLTTQEATQTFENQQNINYRNKFIINCESTVFEHTGVSYCYENENQMNIVSDETKTTPMAEAPSTFLSAPLKKKLTNIFKSLTETTSNVTSPATCPQSETPHPFPNKDTKFILVNTAEATNANKPPICPDKKAESIVKSNSSTGKNLMNSSMTSISSDKNSTISDITFTTNTTTTDNQLDGFTKILVSSELNSPKKGNRHLPSPLRKKSMTTRYSSASSSSDRPQQRMSPDLFNSGRDSKNSILSEEFDDILTITTTDTDKNDSDIVILDYPDVTIPDKPDFNNFLKPSSSKTSLINRFLRNVTQRKILDASIKKNNFFLSKLNNERKLFENLYMKGVKPKNKDLIEDLNAEIAMEIEMSGCRQGRREKCELSRLHLDIGVGEVSVEIFNGNSLHILRNETEVLMKVFKLYTGYNREGHMTPVLVFLTDQTLYVTDLVRNRLCNKFVLPYSELDVILMGPYGNTVLLSNGARDMQQVLLAGGPYPADGLVSSLEMCARRGGSILPAVGQLTLDHLAPLQAFVRDNSIISKNDPWMYYAVVNIPASGLSDEKEPLGPNVKGPLMHRNIGANGIAQSWYASYFLLKAGVLYMFTDASQKIPTSALTLTDCQGVRRAMNAGRPHCFEILLRSNILQLAAPDEYVASEWSQALVQSASGLFEMQETHSTLGCTLVITSNHLMTLREDFSAPLRRVNANCSKSPSKENIDPNSARNLSITSQQDTSSEISSNVSTPSKIFDRRSNSTISTPTKGYRRSSYLSPNTTTDSDEKSYSSMSSFYGKNSGVEILTCAAIKEMIALKISSQAENWWCVLEFSCQEVRENSDDLVIFFATNSELRRFLSMLEKLWQIKCDEPFPVMLINDEDPIGTHCTKLFSEINKSWEPLLSAALGYPQ